MADLFRTCLPGSSRKPVGIGRANTLGLIEAATELEVENATVDGKASGQRWSTSPKELKKRPTTQWVQPGAVKLRIKRFRGEHIRHRSVLCISDEWEPRAEIGGLKSAVALHTSFGHALHVFGGGCRWRSARPYAILGRWSLPQPCGSTESIQARL